MANEQATPILKVVGEQPAWDERLRQRLEAHMAKNPHLTATVLSKADFIGKSPASITAYLDGTYFKPKEQGGLGVAPGGKSALEAAIRIYLDRVETQQWQGFAKEFVETAAWTQVHSACTTAIRERVIVVLHAPPGYGKTRMLAEFCIRHTVTPPAQVHCSPVVTTKFFLQKLTGLFAVTNSRQSKPDLLEAVIEKLKRYPKGIFIDQANFLKEDALGCVCQIWEEARVPIVLAGTKELFNLFEKSPLTESARKQLSSRVRWQVPLRGLSWQEVATIVRGVVPDFTKEEAMAVHQACGGIHRRLDMLMPEYLRLRTSQGTSDIDKLCREATTRLLSA